ncbi:MAG: xylose isomerase [Alphaproteobacteria bacterium]|nr:MAG: xylose isomerase [Alphaproteobacteria bacterium]
MKYSATGMALVLSGCGLKGKTDPLFKISLAEWSLHRHMRGKNYADRGQGLDPQARRSILRYTPHDLLQGDLANLDFAITARREFDIGAIEYVNIFFFGRARDQKYLRELKNRADGEGVRSLLIMCDLEGALGDPDPALRRLAVESHYKWVEAAAFLGCHSVRVNAQSSGTWDEQRKLAVDGLSRLSDYADKYNINILVENHGGISSNGQWLSSVMKEANHPRLGTLPDFGNFKISDTERYDNYKGVAELMPFAKAVSAKSYDFDDKGNETTLDYNRLLNSVTKAGYKGYVGIEYEGKRLSEFDGIRATKALLERVRADLS